MRAFMTFILIVVTATSVNAQDAFTLDEAIRAALVHNHGLLVSDIEAEAAENSVSRGNSGQLPNLAITGGVSTSYTNLDITPGSFFQNLLDPQGSAQQADRPTISYDGVTTTQIHSQVGSQLIIYDGLKGRLRYKVLKNNNRLADLQYRSEVENTILEITNHFIRLASVQTAINVKKTSLEQSKDRYRTVQTRREYGQVNEQQLLQALADLKSDSTDFRNLELRFKNAYRDLHTKIGWNNREIRPIDTDMVVVNIPSYKDLVEQLKQNNTVISIREKRVEQAKLNEQISQAGFLPTLTASIGYGYNYLSATEGQFETQEQLGFNGGLSLKVPIFSGGRNRIETENSAMRIKREELRKEESIMFLRTRFENSWQQYLHFQNQFEIETSNLSVYERNYERAQEMFSRSEISGVELRAAQLSLENAEMRVAEAGFQLKQMETMLLYLSGVLIVDYSY